MIHTARRDTEKRSSYGDAYQQRPSRWQQQMRKDNNSSFAFILSVTRVEDII